jgi:hypothetical protein
VNGWYRNRHRRWQRFLLPSCAFFAFSVPLSALTTDLYATTATAVVASATSLSFASALAAVVSRAIVAAVGYIHSEFPAPFGHDKFHE